MSDGPYRSSPEEQEQTGPKWETVSVEVKTFEQNDDKISISKNRSVRRHKTSNKYGHPDIHREELVVYEIAVQARSYSAVSNLPVVPKSFTLTESDLHLLLKHITDFDSVREFLEKKK